MATEVKAIIDPRGHGDFLDLDAWVADRAGDLPVRDTIEIAEVRGGGNAGRLFIHDTDGWVCDAGHYLQVRAAPGQGHGGVFDNLEHAYLSNPDPLETDPVSPFFNFPPCTVDVKNVGFVRVGPGLSIQQSQTANQLSATVFNIRDLAADGPCMFEGLYMRMGNNRDTITAFGFINTNDTTPHRIQNCIIVSRNQGWKCWRAVFTNGVNSKAVVYNNTLDVSTDGAASQVLQVTAGAITSQNNYVSGYLGGGNYSAGVAKGANDFTHNAEAVTVANRNVAPATAFRGPTSNDYRLRTTSPLVGQGADLSGSGVLRDLMGRKRFVPYDVGAIQLYDNKGNKGSILDFDL